MIILGITNSGNDVAVSLVRDGRYLINSELVSKKDFQTELVEFLAASEVEMSQLDYVAYDEDFDLNTEFIEASSLIINKPLAEKYSLFIEEDDAKEEGASIQFPYLLLDDKDSRSTVYLVTGLDNIKEITSMKPGPFAELLNQIENLLELNNIKLHAFQGDSNGVEMSRLKEGSDLDLKFLLDEVKLKLDEFMGSLQKGYSQELLDELVRNYKQDLASETLEALYDSLIIYLITAANELGVQSISIAGGMADIIPLRQKFTAQTEVGQFEVFFPIRENSHRASMGIAGLAYIGIGK